MITKILRSPGMLFNLLFMAYFAFGQPVVLERLLRVIERGASDPLLGVLFLAAPFLELGGFYILVPPLLERLSQAPRQPSSLPALVWMAHLVLTVVLMLNGFACFNFDTRAGPPLLGVVVLAVIVLKEIFYLLYWVVQADSNRLQEMARRFALRRRPQSLSSGVQYGGGLLLFPFSALSFTGFWSLLVARSPIHWSSPGDAAVELALAIFIFLVIFAAVRSVFLIEEWAFLRGRGPLLVFLATLLLNLLLALAGLPSG